MGGLADTETIPRESRVSGIDGFVNIAVFVVLYWRVPVCPVEADAVCQDLKNIRWTAVWFAVLCSNMIFAADSLTLLDTRVVRLRRRRGPP